MSAIHGLAVALQNLAEFDYPSRTESEETALERSRAVSDARRAFREAYEEMRDDPMFN